MPQTEFEQFRAAVLADPALQEKLRNIDSKEEFIERVVKTGAERGFNFAAADVEDAMRAAHAEWVLRWV